MTTVNKKMSDYKVGECYVKSEKWNIEFLRLKEINEESFKCDYFKLTDLGGGYSEDFVMDDLTGFVQTDNDLYESLGQSTFEILGTIHNSIERIAFEKPQVSEGDIRVTPTGMLIKIKYIEEDGSLSCNAYAANKELFIASPDIENEKDYPLFDSDVEKMEILKCISEDVLTDINAMYWFFFLLTSKIVCFNKK